MLVHCSSQGLASWLTGARLRGSIWIWVVARYCFGDTKYLPTPTATHRTTAATIQGQRFSSKRK